MGPPGAQSSPDRGVLRRLWLGLPQAVRHRLLPVRDFAKTVEEILALSPSPRESARLIAIGSTLLVKAAVGRRDGHLYRVRLGRGQEEWNFFVGEWSDLQVAREVFFGGQYDLPPGPTPRVIVDAGANIGLSVLLFARRFPGAAIHAIEPDRLNLRKLRRNIGHLPNVTVHPVAVGATDGWAVFREATAGWASSLTDDGEGLVVPVRDLARFVRQVADGRADILKLDVEGAEWGILRCTRLANCARLVLGELHRWKLCNGEVGDISPGLDGLEVTYLGQPGDGPFIAM